MIGKQIMKIKKIKKKKILLKVTAVSTKKLEQLKETE